MKFTKLVRWAACGAAAVILGACEKGPAPVARGGPADASTVLPAGLFLEAEPAGVVGVLDSKAAVKAGDRVVIRGKIGGSMDPFVGGRAVFTIMDTGVKGCDEMGDDHCPTPWDYCCEPLESRTANAATIQIVGADGRPLKADLKGVHGLDPLAQVCVVGIVAQRDDAGTLVVNAESVYVKPRG